MVVGRIVRSMMNKIMIIIVLIMSGEMVSLVLITTSNQEADSSMGIVFNVVILVYKRYTCM